MLQQCGPAVLPKEFYLCGVQGELYTWSACGWGAKFLDLHSAEQQQGQGCRHDPCWRPSRAGSVCPEQKAGGKGNKWANDTDDNDSIHAKLLGHHRRLHAYKVLPQLQPDVLQEERILVWMP